MKKIFFLIGFMLCLISCSQNYPEMTTIQNIRNLNYGNGCYVIWDSISGAEKYNVYYIPDDRNNYQYDKSAKKLLTTENSWAFVETASANISVSAILNGKETYLSPKMKGTNTYWTSVKCEKNRLGYSLSWERLPIAEDYVLISQYKVNYVMTEYVTNSMQLKTSNLTEYEHEKTNNNPYSNEYEYRKCKLLKTTDSDVVFTDTCFNTGMYSNFVTLFAKIGDYYYCISDSFKLQ